MNLVLQETLIGKVQLYGAVGEEHERCRRHRRLRHLEDFHARAHGHGRALEIHGFDEAVHRRRRNALAALRGDLFQQLERFSPCLCRFFAEMKTIGA
jgi:hypothetical protein